jgi:CheY-like chemotaxis protein
MKRLTEILSAIANGFRVQRVSQQPLRKVLIVDDDAAVRMFLDSVLVAAGYETTVSADGPEALAAWQQAGPFDVIVTDVMMPQMRGDELAQRVRMGHPDTKVLYVTGYPDALFAGRPRLWEDEAFLEKPFTPDGVLQAVTLLLNGRIQEKAVWG